MQYSYEIKNHDAYMRALLEKKEYRKLEEFLNSSMSKSVELYQYVNCGKCGCQHDRQL